MTWTLFLWGAAAIVAWVAWDRRTAGLWVLAVALIVVALLIDPQLAPEPVGPEIQP